METQDNENTEKQSEKEKEISTNETVIQSEQSTIPGTHEEDIETLGDTEGSEESTAGHNKISAKTIAIASSIVKCSLTQLRK